MSILHEEWRPVSRVPGYEVSNFGDVRRTSRDRFGRRPIRLSKSPDRHGHLFVTMSAGTKAGGRCVRAAVNRLVYEAFIGPIPDGHRVKHKDKDKANCQPSNLITTDRPRVRDYTGEQFGYWTAIAFHKRGPGRSHLWLCRCECGVEKIVGIHHLRYGASQSCGCKSAELAKDKISGVKHYNWKGGIRNIGSLAWCNHRLDGLRQSIKQRKGCAPIASTPGEVLGLWNLSRGLCVACGAQPRRLCLDHDKHTGKCRGFICDTCNVALGMAGDSPDRLRKLAEYLEIAKDGKVRKS